MSGNVAEWEDSCATTNGQNDSCHIRGGSHYADSDTSHLRCDASDTTPRSNFGEIIGFRCCGP
jgi:formylglycine-generating enzyme